MLSLASPALVRAALWTAPAALAFGLANAAQDPPPPPMPPPLVLRTDPYADLPRGVLPEGASDEARMRFAALRSALAPAQGERTPLTRFRLLIQLIHRSEQNNTLEGTHSYLAPSYVKFEAEGHAMGIGPQGYWKRDGERRFALEGRDYQKDRDSIDEMLAISRNFIELLDPARWRVVSATALTGPIAPLPGYKHLVYEEEQLDWISIDTPDFRLPRAAGGDGAQRLYRVAIGCERASGQPTFAFVQELHEGTPVWQGSLCVHLGNWWATDGYALPQYVTAHRALPPSPAAPLAFEERPSWEFGMLKASLAPDLEAADFLGL